MAGLFGAIERSFISVWNPTADPKKSINVKTAASYSCSTFGLPSFAMGLKRPKEALPIPKLVLQLQVVYCPKVTMLKSPMLLGGGWYLISLIN